MPKPRVLRLCEIHAKTVHGPRVDLVHPDDCERCLLERLKDWADRHGNP